MRKWAQENLRYCFSMRIDQRSMTGMVANGGRFQLASGRPSRAMRG
jgi:hypothetical protein